MGWRWWLLPVATLILVAGGLVVGFRLHEAPPIEEPQPRDCSLNPAQYLTGTFLGWKLARVSADGGGEISARIRLDDGREIVAYNATGSALEPDARVTVSEIICVHRTVYLLTEFGAGDSVSQSR